MEPPADFNAYHSRILGLEFMNFMSYIGRPLGRYSIRVNTLKSSERDVTRFLRENHVDYGRIPWCPDGLWVSSNELDTLEHQLGYYYIQDASSMIPAEALDPKPGERVLDLCASPGSKTTQIAAKMGNRGVLVANEPNYTRLRGLVYNIQRCGIMNCVITKRDGCSYSKFGEKFARVLVDAPCSDVGTVRRNPFALKFWSVERIRKLSNLQRKLALEGFRMLEKGGTMVYSTCTTSVEENETVVESVLDGFKDARLEEIRLDGLKSMPGLTERTRKCVRVLPQHNDTDSFFIAKVVKNG
ncbi:MAG: RsmB/NOP family class I SAM-dependent RNA methyltransferase [Candidatus Altiarchaeota archaeon]|nr:RsmB/NOP family class I SAM-dependent RNA methyltransferase [Candidatus Altiarchaeota archaeon]